MGTKAYDFMKLPSLKKAGEAKSCRKRLCSFVFKLSKTHEQRLNN